MKMTTAPFGSSHFLHIFITFYMIYLDIRLVNFSDEVFFLKRARIIYNPTSGREIFRKELPKVLQRLEEAGYETSAHATKGEGDATYAAKVAVERQYDLVVVAGGDGTINE